MHDNLFNNLLIEFLSESNERINHIEEIMLALQELSVPDRGKRIDEAKREMHTLKGNSGMMGFNNIQNLCHELEDRIAIINIENPEVDDILEGIDRCRILLKSASSDSQQDNKQASTEAMSSESIRVPFTSLDDMVDRIAEVIIKRNRLRETLANAGNSLLTTEVWDEIKTAEEDLSRSIGFLYSQILRLRMVPLRDLFRQMKRLVYEEAAREGKQIEFLSQGGDTPIDKALLEVASEALGHIVRNAVVHGIELPDERESSGKKRIGRIMLTAQMTGNGIIVDIEDDGRGINKEKLIEYSAQHGIALPPGDNPYSILFVSGFSTKKNTDLQAGRGIGLSAVREAVRRMGGQIDVESEEGIGTQFRLRLPLNVSIIRALMLKADDENYALPINSILANLKILKGDLHEVNNSLVFRWRDELIPILDIGLLFGTSLRPRESGYLVIIEAAGKNRGLLVDDIQGFQEIVVKGLDPLIGKPQGISGSTILGNGQAILILDAMSLVSVNPFLEINQ